MIAQLRRRAAKMIHEKIGRERSPNDYVDDVAQEAMARTISRTAVMTAAESLA